MFTTAELDYDFHLPEVPERTAAGDLVFVAKGLAFVTFLYATWRLSVAASEFLSPTTKTLQPKQVRVWRFQRNTTRSLRAPQFVEPASPSLSLIPKVASATLILVRITPI